MKDISYFDLSTTSSTGGVTGSSCVRSRVKADDADSGKRFQLKPSILDNTLARRIKDGYVDRANFGEVIASHIGRAILGDDSIPEVSLVYDKTRKRVLVASKYLEGDLVRTLDVYAQENGFIPLKKQRHASFIADSESKVGAMGLDGLHVSGLKRSLAKSIVISAVLGDHDINPGNMVVVTRDGESEVKRIDLGHAFNDLLNAMAIHGGQLRNKENAMMDFFNRKHVAGVGGDPSKLWRDYPGLVQSQEIVEALNELVADYKENLALGIASAENEFKALLEEMAKNDDEKGTQHVYKSLCAIYKNISGQDFKGKPAEIMKKAFAEFAHFIEKNCENTREVADTMQLQIDIDRALKLGGIVDNVTLQQIKEKHAGDKPRQWIKVDKKIAEFYGDTAAYISSRARKFEHDKTQKTRSSKEINSLDVSDYSGTNPVLDLSSSAYSSLSSLTDVPVDLDLRRSVVSVDVDRSNVPPDGLELRRSIVSADVDLSNVIPAGVELSNDAPVVLDLFPTSIGNSQAQKMKGLSTDKYKKDASILLLLKKIPLLSGFLRGVNQTGGFLGRLATMQGNNSVVLDTLGTGSQFTGLTLLAVDFFRIPAIYLAAWIVGSPSPITLSKNARRLYSGVLLGLTIAALAAPIAVPPIAFALAGLGLGFGMATMTKTFYYWNQLPKKLAEVKEKIATATEALIMLHTKTLGLEEGLLTTAKEGNDADKIAALQQELGDTVKAFDTLFQDKEVMLQKLYDEKHKYEAELKNHDTAAVMDKGVAISLAAIVLAGLALSLLFPPLGVSILAASAIASVAYIVGRLSFTLINGLISGQSSKKGASEFTGAPVGQQEDKHAREVLDTLDTSISAEAPHSKHDSTATTVKLLIDDQKAYSALHKQPSHSQSNDVLGELVTTVRVPTPEDVEPGEEDTVSTFDDRTEEVSSHQSHV